MSQPKTQADLASSAAIFNTVCDIDATPITAAEDLALPTSAAAGRLRSIPPLAPARLREPDAAPTPFPSEPVRFRHTSSFFDEDAASDTVLYLAFGSNLCAKTFQGKRGIRPLGKINVSAPALRLVFDLPGIPYAEPRFANTALRSVPKPPVDPPSTPPGLPDVPDLPSPPAAPSHQPLLHEAEKHDSGAQDPCDGPVWDKGLIGVVYEVTRKDFAHIIATEGGGASYRDILVPCLPLPLPDSKPTFPPKLPRPFLAHTLYQPPISLPDDRDDCANGDKTPKAGLTERRSVGNLSVGNGDGDDGNDDDDDRPKFPDWAPKWLRRLMTRSQRSGCGQPSERYLNLLREGARENDLPADYQAYLAALPPYTINSWRQRVGQVLFLATWAPLFVTFVYSSRLFADEKGKLPTWCAMILTVASNLLWLSYDRLFEPTFGNGEKTMDQSAARKRRGSWCRHRGEEGSGLVGDEEKRRLLASESY